MAYWEKGNGHILYSGNSVLLSETATLNREIKTPVANYRRFISL